MSPNIPVLAIDGPGGSGKGTIAQAVATQLGWHYLDSGALYRTLGLLAQRGGVALDDQVALVALARDMAIDFRAGAVFLRDENVDQEIRTESAGTRASRLAPQPAVRAALLIRQRRCAQPPGLVADGRDMGSVVFPQAACKIFLTASAQARAARRVKQLSARGMHGTIAPVLAEVLAEIEQRDRRDSTRAASPLRRADDAYALDTTHMSIAEATAAALAQVAKIHGNSPPAAP